MEKQKWTQRPITWGGYAILCGVLSAISIVTSAVYYVVLADPSWWKNTKKFIRALCKGALVK